MTSRTLSEAAAKWFENRGISAETAAKHHVFTGRRAAAGDVEPDPSGNILVFPFVDHGIEVNDKYRTHPKQFWQRAGGKKTFWNADVLDDPALHEGRSALVITEGECDALTAIDCGYPFAVSVPDGAPPVPAGKAPDDLEPVDAQAEQSGKFEYMWNNRDRLKKIKRFIIASDGDEPGQRLAAELVRRLSAAKCSFIAYPPDSVVPAEGGLKRRCKDLNEVRIYFGQAKVIDIITSAQPYPVRGLYKLSDYPAAQDLETYAVGWDGWGSVLRVFLGEFVVVTGIPSHGKTTWVLNLIANLAMIHQWRIAVCSPEMPTVPMLRDKLRRYFIGSKPVLGEPEKLARADAWVEQNFSFIDIDPTGTGDADEAFDLDWIIERATDAVLRDGIRVLVVDPWNEIEHAKRRDETGSEYIARGIRALKRFGRMYGVMVIVVAHPTKDVGKDGKHRLVTLYDIDGAAHWFNKADHGIVVSRSGNKTTVYIQKVRHEPDTGAKGEKRMTYNQSSGRFEPEPDVDEYEAMR